MILMIVLIVLAYIIGCILAGILEHISDGEPTAILAGSWIMVIIIGCLLITKYIINWYEHKFGKYKN